MAPAEHLSRLRLARLASRHIHLKISALGHQLITTQLYFQGDEHVADDIASAVKPELILAPPPSDQMATAAKSLMILSLTRRTEHPAMTAGAVLSYCRAEA